MNPNDVLSSKSAHTPDNTHSSQATVGFVPGSKVYVKLDGDQLKPI